MRTLPIYQVDAFASQIFSGNPAAVVPLTEWLPDQTMQKIAAENNISETAFFVKGSAPSTYHLRWFTPKLEIDLCGHATLATAFIIEKFLEPGASKLSFTTEKAGSLHVTLKDDRLTLDFPARMPAAYEWGGDIADALGTDEIEEVLMSRDLFVVLKSVEAVESLQPDMQLVEKLDGIGITVTAKGTDADVYSRFFAPKAGITEDPVTGSAHCNIVPYWSQRLDKKNLYCIQGGERKGELNCSYLGDRVTMTGSCMLFLKGEIYI